MIRFLHAADLHLGAPFSALPPEQAALRRREQLELVRTMLEKADEMGCRAVFLAGDVFDAERVGAERVDAVKRACAACRADIFIAPGNHDCCRRGSVYEDADWPGNVHIFTKREISRVDLQDFCVYGAGFTQVCEESMLEGFHARPDGVRFMVLHGDALQKDSPYNPISRAQIEASNLTYLALGHIHQASGLLSAGKTAYAWPGCAMGRGFDELGEKGVYLGEVSDAGEVRLEFLPLGGRKYEILHVQAGDDAKSAIERALPAGTQSDIYRIILTGESGPVNVRRLEQDLQERFFGLSIRDETRPKRELWKNAGEDTLRGLFLQTLRTQYDAAEDDDTRRKIAYAAKLGLDAMEDRLEVEA